MKRDDKFLENCRNGNLKETKKLLSRLLFKPEINTTDKDLNTGLHLAIKKGHVELSELLISTGININARNKERDTALHIATNKGNLDIVKLLVSKGALINSKEANEYSALHEAIDQGYPKIAKFLILSGADINAKTKNGDTPLIRASRSGCRDIVSLLITKGADVKVQGCYKETALYKASEAGDIKIAELLIAAGADVNAINNTRMSSLHKASENGYTALAGFLISKGAEVNASDDYGEIPLHKASYFGHPEIVKLLISKNTEINAQNKDGLTALHYAAGSGNFEIASLLLKSHIKFNLQDNSHHSALFYTYKSKNLQILDSLSEKCSNKQELKDLYDKTFSEIKFQDTETDSFLTKLFSLCHEYKVRVDSPLIKAFKNGDNKILISLLNNKSPLDHNVADSDRPNVWQDDTLLSLTKKSFGKLIQRYPNSPQLVIAAFFYWRYKARQWFKTQKSKDFVCDSCNTGVNIYSSSFLIGTWLRCHDCTIEKVLLPSFEKLKSDPRFFGKDEVDNAIDYILHADKLSY